MKSNQSDNSRSRNNRIFEKLFNDPNGYAVETAERNEDNIELMMQLLEAPPEYLFNNGACHIYAICLKNADPRFMLQALSAPGGRGGLHVYCKLGKLAIDVDGVHLESDLIKKWKPNPSVNIISCKVTESELMQSDKNRSKTVNVRGHSLHEPFVKRAIKKAEAHIAQHLPSWRHSLV